jgi:1-hydroxycarotenoid 3,4-desaturase
MPEHRVVVIGAGIGGLVAALDLAVAGCAVTVLERQPEPGGKMRCLLVGGTPIDAGPTVFTMRWVFEEVFANAGACLADHVGLRPANILARHAWDGGGRLDLFADLQASAAAIGAFAGAAEAAGFLAFSQASRRIYDTLEKPFLRGTRPTPLSLVRSAGIADMLAISPFDTLMRALGRHFSDPRLRQLFGRYATYCGSSPYLAPATLMLVAHVERDGVWLVDGGMHALARALASLAAAHGVQFHYQADVDRIELAAGRVQAAVVRNGARFPADAIVLNADPAALPAGCFGAAVAGAVRLAPATRSLSAVTWALRAHASGFPLSRHNVFFSADYAAEFADLFDRRNLPRAPTVYLCAQDRADDGPSPSGDERLLCLVNAPATGDTHQFSPAEIDACADRSFSLLARCGLHVRRMPGASVTTAPHQFNALFPATGGALYGPAVHGPMATFRRPGSRTKLPGLYLAGGGTHPGAGVPMAALSGRLAAASVIADGGSTGRSRPVAMPGGISTRSATMEPAG